MALIIILSVGAPLCLVVVILGCLNCFMKRKPAFSPFSNPGFVEEGTAGRNNDAFAVDMEPTITPSDESHVTIESLPDVSPKSVPLPPLRPKILSIDKDSQNSGVSFFGSHRPFPRENLTYLNPLGVGWFGQVILSEALRISTGSMRSQVVVKMLKDDASSVEEKQFIDEIIPFRHLDHPNVISLLGQCTETRPYLYIVEYAPNGDLKSFLQSHKQHMDTLLKKNKLLHFCLDIAAGVACIHRHNFVHCDLSTRACFVMTDHKIKIGDYGLAEQSFKEDYFQGANELLPIRWMAPECLATKDEGNSWSSQNYSKASDVWSFGVLLWEVFSMAEQPYGMLTDEAVLQGVVIDRVVSLSDMPLRVPFHDRLSALMNECWKDPAERICIEPAHRILEEMSREKVERVADELDFEQKWNHLIPNTQSRSQSLASEDGSAIALAGSFSSESPFNYDDKPSSAAPSDIGSETQNDDVLQIDDNAQAVEDVFSNEPVSLQSDLSKETRETDQSTAVKVEMDVTSLIPDTLTPKKPAQQMTTSTPLAEKSVQNKTSTSPFLTAPNTPNSQYITAEEGFTTENSAIESSNASQVNGSFGFDSLTSSEGNSTVQESEIDVPEKSLEDDTNVINKIEEAPPQNNNNEFDDFVSFTNGTNAMQGSTENLAGDDLVSDKPQELDASFDIIVPSMLDDDRNTETTTQQPQAPSTPQNASLDFLSDFAGNNNQSASSSDINPFSNGNIFPPMAEASSTLASFDQEQQLDGAQNGLNKPAPNQTSDNSSFETGVLESTSSNPFSSSNTSNPFSTSETTSASSSQDAALFFNKSEIDASSSLNSSSLLGGWDTSFPESIEPTREIADSSMNLHQSSASVPNVNSTEGPNEISSPVTSSDFSFLDTPPAVSDTVLDSVPEPVPDTTNNATTESLLSGFDSTPSSNVNPVSSLFTTQVDDMFGSAPIPTATQSSPFFNDEESKTTTASDFQAPSLSTSDPFDFSAFESKSSVTNVSEEIQQKPAEFDIFSSGFNEPVKTNEDQEKKGTPTDFPGLDLFSSDTTPAASQGTTSLLEGDLLSSALTPAENQVGTSTVYKCDDSNSFPDHSEEEESGIINSCHSLTESSSAVPTNAASTSDSCYVSGLVTDSRIAEEMSSSEEISSRAFVANDICDGVCEADSDHLDHHSDSTEVEDISLSNNGQIDKGELRLDLDDGNSVNDDSECNNISEETSSTSGSEREYNCVNPFDTGQPPTIFDPDHDDKENLDPDYVDKDTSFDDLNEQDLKIVSEIYLSRGVKSPRVFEVPTLETIPEHQQLHSVSEDAIPTPSETSSVGPRDDEFYSDSYEWDDDFYGDSLIGKDDTGPEMDEVVPQSPIGVDQNNISNWSLDFEADISHYSGNSSNNTSVFSTTLNRSDSACISGKNTDNDKPSISNQNVQCLSDSELLVAKNSTTTAISRPSLVASTLAKHRNRNMQFSSPLKSSSKNKGNFYSLMEDFDDFQLDSSQEGDESPVNLSDDDEFSFALNKKSYLFHHSPQTVSSSSFPLSSSSSPVLPNTLLNSSSHASTLSPKKPTDVLAIDNDTRKDSKVSSATDVNSTSSPAMDLLGLGFDPITPSSPPNTSNDMLTGEQNLGDVPAGNPQEVTSSAAPSDPFDSLI